MVDPDAKGQVGRGRLRTQREIQRLPGAAQEDESKPVGDIENGALGGRQRFDGAPHQRLQRRLQPDLLDYRLARELPEFQDDHARERGRRRGAA